MISILILTKNEEVNIRECIQSVGWSDDIWVFDSFSSDKTCEIASGMSANVRQRIFDNYGSQREAARCLPYKYPWVLAIDADERPEKELVDELIEVAKNPDEKHVAFRLRRKDHFMGKWIKYSSLYPSWFIRFYKPDKIRYEPRAVHEYAEIDGELGELKEHLLHFSFSKGIEEWFAKHVRYAAFEAKENAKSLATSDSRHGITRVMSFDPVIRRRALKQLSVRLPFRSSLRFLYSFVFRLGFLDGVAGYRYAKMLAIYEQMIVLNLCEQLSKSDDFSVNRS
jgi:glycosyltransferase involved in cell wall biosynthesis